MTSTSSKDVRLALLFAFLACAMVTAEPDVSARKLLASVCPGSQSCAASSLSDSEIHVSNSYIRLHNCTIRLMATHPPTPYLLRT